MNEYFSGHYYKHQKGESTISFIPGYSSDGEFIQIITNTASYHVPYINGNIFNKDGIKVNIKDKDFCVCGEIKYSQLTPIKYDIMGIFKYFPMECRHGIISMHHVLSGGLIVNGQKIDFTDGVGYIENDSGTSFPKSYLWAQCNDFPQKCSVMVSVANIPFYGFKFRGCICIVYYLGIEYRLATYLGVKVITCNKNQVVLKQGRYRLEISVSSQKGQSLYAPNIGKMSRTIHETAACKGTFKFYYEDRLLFDFTSNNVSFEFVE